MRNARLLFLSMLLFAATQAFGQQLSRKVSFHYENERLGHILR